MEPSKDLMAGIFALSALGGLVVIVALKLWLDYKRKEMAHKERMTAMDKGLALPPPEEKDGAPESKAHVHLKLGMWFLALGVALTAGLITYRIVHTGPVDGSVAFWAFLTVVWLGLGGANLLIYRMLKPNGRPQP
jgi:hypothetical protein